MRTGTRTRTPTRSTRFTPVLLIIAACANTTNITDPAQPRFARNYSTSSPSAPQQIKVVTWNIRLGRDVGGAIRVLGGEPLQGADVISLQEMDERGVDSIARVFKLNYVYYPSVVHPTDKRHFGPAILTPWPIDRDWKVLLPHEGLWRNQRRTATVALIRIGGRHVRVYAVHLEPRFRLTSQARNDQMRAIIADLGASAELAIVAGDINGSDVAQMLATSGFEWATKGIGKTTTFASLDHIFARGLVGSGAGVVRDVAGASDHRPAWALLKIPPPR